MSTANLFFVGVIDLFVTQFSFQWLRFGFECPVGSFYTQEQTWLADPNRKEIYNCETEIHISFVRSIIHPHLFFLLHQETDCCVRSGCCRCRCYFLRHIRNVLPVQQNIEWICFISPLCCCCPVTTTWYGKRGEGERSLRPGQVEDPSGWHKMWGRERRRKWTNERRQRWKTTTTTTRSLWDHPRRSKDHTQLKLSKKKL